MQKFYNINDLVVDSYFKDFLVSTKNKCCRMILCVESSGKCNFIAPSDKTDMISYLPKNRQVKVIENRIDPFSEEAGRNRMKVGRLIAVLFSEDILKEFDITNADIEEFVNLYKSFFSLDSITFKVVEGEEIKKWYHDINYLQLFGCESSPLWKSCMRHRSKQALLNLYRDNPTQVKLLVMLQKDENGEERLRARALLWQDAKSNTTSLKVMDRIYAIHDSDVFVFKKWARENGYISKFYQNSKSFELFDIEGEPTQLSLTIKLASHQYQFYPYLDTFQFYNIWHGEFKNSPFMYDYQLNRADGDIYHQEEEGEPDFVPDEEF